MVKTYTIKELRCPDCAKSLAVNLAKIEFIKEININYDRKEITIEGRRDLTEEEIKMILETVVSLSHCPRHNRHRLKRNNISPNSHYKLNQIKPNGDNVVDADYEVVDDDK